MSWYPCCCGSTPTSVPTSSCTLCQELQMPDYELAVSGVTGICPNSSLFNGTFTISQPIGSPCTRASTRIFPTRYKAIAASTCSNFNLFIDPNYSATLQFSSGIYRIRMTVTQGHFATETWSFEGPGTTAPPQCMTFSGYPLTYTGYTVNSTLYTAPYDFSAATLTLTAI